MSVLPRGFVLVVGAAALVVVAGGVRSVAWLLGPAYLAFVIVLVVSPAEQRLRRRGVPGWASVGLLVLLVQGVVLVLAAVLVVSVAQLATILPQYAGEAGALVQGATETVRQLGVGAEQVRAAAAAFDVGRLVALIGVLLAGVTGLATNLVFLLSLMLFLSVESTGAADRLAALTRSTPALGTALSGFARGTRRYLVVTTVFGLAVGIIDVVALALMGVPLALLWGLLVFITNYIPYVGFWLGVFPPVLLGLLVGGWPLAVAVFAVMSVVNFLLCTLAQPRFVGDAVGLSVTVTFLGLAFWGSLLGTVGAVLAVPLTLLVKAVLVEPDPRAAWADAVLSSTGRLRGAAIAAPAAEPPERPAPNGRGARNGRRPGRPTRRTPYAVPRPARSTGS